VRLQAAAEKFPDASYGCVRESSAGCEGTHLGVGRISNNRGTGAKLMKCRIVEPEIQLGMHGGKTGCTEKHNSNVE
jgi:hypothetical protein